MDTYTFVYMMALYGSEVTLGIMVISLSPTPYIEECHNPSAHKRPFQATKHFKDRDLIILELI